jgi:hypothetical protein
MNENTETFRHFAFVVNGVVEEVMSINSGQDWNKFIELYASKPVVIEVPDSLNNFGKGYLWDGENFSPPA